MSRVQYVQKHPDLKNHTQFMYPSLAKRIGLKNVHTIFPRSFDPSAYSPYELKRMGTMHNNALLMHDFGLTDSKTFDPRFLNGEAWKITTRDATERARHTLKRSVENNQHLRARVSRRVNARGHLKNSKEFKLWREHVRYRPQGSGYESAKRDFYEAVDRMNRQQLNELLELLGD